MWVQSSFVCSQCTTGSYRSIIYYYVFMIRHIRTNFTTRCSVVFKCACTGCFLSSSCKGLGSVSIVESRVRSVRVIRITIRVGPRGVAVFYGPPAGEVAWNVGVARIKESELYKIERLDKATRRRRRRQKINSNNISDFIRVNLFTIICTDSGRW